MYGFNLACLGALTQAMEAVQSHQVKPLGVSIQIYPVVCARKLIHADFDPFQGRSLHVGDWKLG